jgi:hypothetical protein
MAMTDPEREHFVREIEDLRRSLRRSYLLSAVLAALLIVPLVGGGFLAMLHGVQLQRAVHAERAAREAAEQARQEAERAVREKAEAEKARGRADDLPGQGRGKD